MYLCWQDVDLKKLPEPFIETEASLSIIVDEYDPMRPNDYEVVKEKFREEREHERAERGDRHERTENRERTRDRDYDRGERYGHNMTRLIIDVEKIGVSDLKELEMKQ